MKKAGLIVLFSFLVFTVFSMISVSDIAGPIGSKKAVWNITRALCDPSCYKPSPLTHAVASKFYKMTFEFKSSKSLVAAGDLWIAGELISNKDTGKKSFKNLSAISSGWADGTTGDIDWDGDIFQLTKVNGKHFILNYDKFKINAGTTGEVKIIIIADSRNGKITYYTEKKILIIKPCFALPIGK